MKKEPDPEWIKTTVNSLNNLLLGLHGYLHFMETNAKLTEQDNSYLGPMRELLNRAYDVSNGILNHIQGCAPSQLELPIQVTPSNSLDEAENELPTPSSSQDATHEAATQPVHSPLPELTNFTESLSKATSSPLKPEFAVPPQNQQATSQFSTSATKMDAGLAPTAPITKRGQQSIEDFGIKIVNPNGRKELLMLIDDEEHLLFIGSKMLADEGYRVIACQETFDALKIFNEIHDQIALVILDYSMPVMNGEDVFLEMLEIDPEVKVVLSSGYFEYEVVGRLLKRGLRAFLPKPYRRESLLQNVTSAISS